MNGVGGRGGRLPQPGPQLSPNVVAAFGGGGPRTFYSQHKKSAAFQQNGPSIHKSSWGDSEMEVGGENVQFREEKRARAKKQAREK